MTASILEIKKVGKRFGSKKVLQSIDLTLPQGESVALLGPNGGGKTTLLRLCSGLLGPSEGEILFKGVPLKKSRKTLIRETGYFPEFPSLYDQLTVWENLLFFGRLKGLSAARIRETCELYLVRLNLMDCLKQKTFSLSKGTKYKISLCRAFMGDPRILFMDEPATGLAPEVVEFFTEILKERKKKGLTLIYTSHNMDMTTEISDRIVLINRTVAAMGTIAEFSEQYFTPRWRLRAEEITGEMIDRIKAVGGIRILHSSEDILIYERTDSVKEQNDILKILMNNGCRILSLVRDRHTAGEIYKAVFSQTEEENHANLE